MAVAVIESLPALSPEELREVVTRASFLLNPTGQAPSTAKATSDGLEVDTGPDMSLLWSEIRSAMEAKGELVPPLPIALRNKSITTMLRRATESTLSLIRQQFRAKGSLEDRKVTRLLVGLVIQDISKRDKLLLRLVLKRLETPERTVDKHFPGYRTSGLLSMLVHRDRVVDRAGRELVV